MMSVLVGRRYPRAIFLSEWQWRAKKSVEETVNKKCIIFLAASKYVWLFFTGFADRK